MNSSGYSEITRLCLTVAQSDPLFENIDPAEVNISSNSPSAVNTNLSFLKHGLIQPFVKEEQTFEEKEAIDTNGKKKIESAKSQKLTEWLDAALVDFMPSNLLSNTQHRSSSANTVADEIWKESVSYFGPALCFLYVSRHGLTENELFTLLIKHSGNTADNDVNIYSNRVHSRGSRSGIRQSKEATPSLSASASRQLPMEVTKTLIKLLETVGLLHSKQFKVNRCHYTL